MDEKDKEIKRLKRELKKCQDAATAAYDHLDQWGVVSGGSEREHESQEKVFDLLRPIVSLRRNWVKNK